MKKILTFFVATLFFATTGFAAVYKFSGGPSGGTFQFYASAIATLAKDINMRVLASSSAGSVENLRLVNSGRSHFGITYAVDLFEGSKGMLRNDTKIYKDVLIVAKLYAAPAQLVVRANSGITSAKQLEGKRVAVGNAGSGAAANAERFFRSIGLWDKIDKQFLGYRQAAEAFNNGQLDAFWIFAGFPNSSISEAALQTDIRVLNIWNESENLLEQYPNFEKVVIPANTYKGQTEDVVTFQDAALWTANRNVPEDDLYKLIEKVFSPEGLKYMVSVHKSAEVMDPKTAIEGVITEVHPAALKYFKNVK